MRPLAKYGWMFVAVFLGFLQAPSLATAQYRFDEKAPAQAGPTPRAADGNPDLSGVWINPIPNLKSRLTRTTTTGPGQPAKPTVPLYKPAALEKVKQLNADRFKQDPAWHCMPYGVPRITGAGENGGPMQIIQTPHQVVILYENMHSFRLIPTDGRAHDQNIDPSYLGDSVGRWEGDTLVVDVTNFNDKTWLGGEGWFHSEKLHVVERYSRPDASTLVYEATVEDPEVLSQPWTLTPRRIKLNGSDDRLIEDPPCIEAEMQRDAEEQKLGQKYAERQ
jgi:hypothetical protein